MARKSPEKIYSGVKSKVAGNLKSIRKSQVRNSIKKVSSAQKEENNFSTVGSSFKKSIVPTSSFNNQDETYPKKPTYKSKLANDQMEAIVANIRSRLSQDKILKMTNEEL